MPPKRTPVKNTPAKKLEVDDGDELDALVHLRDQAVDMLVQLKQELKDLPIRDRTGPRLKLSQKRLEMAYSEFGAAHDKVIQLVDATERGPQDAKKREVLAIYGSIFMTLEAWVEEMALAKPGPSNVVVPTGPQQQQQPFIVQQPLPRILPTFDGRYESWERFKLMFKDIVDKSNEPARMKLYHLEKALIGSAAGILDEKTIQDGNYDHAWEVLKERYEDKRRMVDIHIGGLLKVPKVARESHTELRTLVETVVGHVENLKYLGQEFSGVSEQIVVYLLAHALDGETKKHWEATVKRGELPKYEETIQFLKNRVFILERCEETSEPTPKQRQNPDYKPRATEQSYQIASTAMVLSQSEIRCDICGCAHLTFKCAIFRGLTVIQRLEKAKERKVCFNCLRSGHYLRNCPSTHSCRKCRRRHHTLLHQQSPTLQHTDESEPKSRLETQPTVLPTVVVHLRDEKNRPVPCRLLLDNGSQVNFITEQMANKLNKRRAAANVPICGIGAVKIHVRESMVVQLESRYSSFAMDVECLIVPEVTGMIPSNPISISNWPIPATIQLADPKFNLPDRIDMLLGVSMFFKLLKSEQLQLSERLPVLQETYLGWVVAGDVGDSLPGPQFSHIAALDKVSEVSKLSVKSSTSTAPHLSARNRKNAFFHSTRKRIPTGCPEARLPSYPAITGLVDNRSRNLRYILPLEKQLKRDQDLKPQLGGTTVLHPISKQSFLPIQFNEPFPAGTSPQPGGRMLAA